ncbi:uncharacterized protein LOC122304823 [Carya illinoinensis]|uniref:uncharacterized protein LOC122304823 n=1 Tax=Carya illinoinensis TaxID=32201 RepID=UPI001C71D107|nr:uncharacterized protein LOC122304823 [Carya illinoinensis]
MAFRWRRAAKQNPAGWIHGVMPIVISWCLWKARCSARMEGVLFQVMSIIQHVKIMIKNISCNVNKFQAIKKTDLLVMKGLNIPIVPIKNIQVTFVKWEWPRRGMVKLNVDGGARLNPREAGGGAFIQDYKGKCIAGFVHHYRVATNTVAECCALLDSLRICKNLRLHNVLVKLDSLVIMSWLASRICRLWFLWNFWEEIKEISMEINARFRHVFREANMVADFLAKKGTMGDNTNFVGLDFECTRLSGLIRMDRLGLVFIREK